jgi:hypothetical protein
LEKKSKQTPQHPFRPALPLHFDVQVTKQMGHVVKGMEKAMASMNLEEVCCLLLFSSVCSPLLPL